MLVVAALPARPKVSVYIAVHNYERYVGEAIESVLGQSLTEVECIVIDDASSDRSWDVVQKYRDDARVKLLRHYTNRGHIATYLTGIANSRGKYLVNLNADDRTNDPEALLLQSNALDADERIGLVFSDVTVIDESGGVRRMHRVNAPERLSGPLAFRRLLFDNFITHSGTMVRRTVLEDVGAYDAHFFHGTDRELWLRISARYDLAHIRRPLWAYRIHPGNMHSSSGYEDSLREAVELIDTALRYAPVMEPGLRERALAHQYVARAAVWLRLGETKRAFSDMHDALRLHPRSVLDAELLRGAASRLRAIGTSRQP